MCCIEINFGIAGKEAQISHKKHLGMTHHNLRMKPTKLQEEKLEAY